MPSAGTIDGKPACVYHLAQATAYGLMAGRAVALLKMIIEANAMRAMADEARAVVAKLFEKSKGEK